MVLIELIIMTSTSDQKELAALSKIVLVFHGAVWVLLWILENLVHGIFLGTALGFLFGSVIVVVNLQILGRGWAPLLLFSKGAALAFFSMLFSLLFLGVTAFFIFQKFPSSLFGFALGFACLPIGACFYAFRLARDG